MIAWMIGSIIASADTLSLSIFPATQKLDWSSPTTLTRSTLRSTIAGIGKKGSMDIGHVAIHLNCSTTEKWAGMSRQNKRESLDLVLKRGAGMGTLLHNFQGKLDSPKDIQEWQAIHAERGTLRVVDFEVSSAKCQELLNALTDYESSNQQFNYGLANNPFDGDGAGCSAFGAYFTAISGHLDEQTKSDWSHTVYIPRSLIGPHHQVRYDSMLSQPHRAEQEYNRTRFVSLYFRNHSWDTEDGIDTVPLFFFSPDRMYEWAEAMRHAEGTPGGPVKVMPEGNGWRLVFEATQP